MTFHRSGGSVPPPPASTPPSTLASVLPPLPPELEEAVRVHAARRQIGNAAVSTTRLVQGLRRGPRTPSTDRLLAAVDEAASPPTRAQISMGDGGSVGRVVPPAPRPPMPPRRNTPEPQTVVPASEVRLDELPNWPTLRAEAAELAPDLPVEALDRAGKWRGLPKWGGPDAQLVVGIARALIAKGTK